MKFMLDTNICIYLIRETPIQVKKRFQTISVGDVCISSITVAELQYGIEKSEQQDRNRAALKSFLTPLVIMDFDFPAAVQFGKIRRLLETKGTPIGAYDLLLAAHAQSLDLSLVTNNIREFARIPNLRIENWAE